MQVSPRAPVKISEPFTALPPAPRRLLFLAALCVCSAAISSSSATGQAAPRVRLIATGGTISNSGTGRLTAGDLVQLVPNVSTFAKVEAEQFSNVASAELTIDQWSTLSKRINALFVSESDLAGIVVTAGTDTLEELAYFLHLTVHSDRPVVVVGAMRGPGAPGFEGPANLIQGVQVAASPESRAKGVLVVLNNEINSAREVTKSDAHLVDAFDSHRYGLLGVVDTDRVVYFRSVSKRHTARSEFSSDGTQLPRVDVILTYQEAPGDLIKAAVDQGAKGIVIASAGAGTLTRSQTQAVTAATGKGVVVVISTRTGGGRISAGQPREQPWIDVKDLTQAETTQRQRRVIAAEDLSPVKARVLLMLALGKTADVVEIQRMFTEY